MDGAAAFYDTSRLIRFFSGIDATDVRVRAKSWTGAAMRLPHPRFVQTWLFALWR